MTFALMSSIASRGVFRKSPSGYPDGGREVIGLPRDIGEAGVSTLPGKPDVRRPSIGGAGVSSIPDKTDVRRLDIADGRRTVTSPDIASRRGISLSFSGRK